jgi:hypothetical protein
MNATALRLLGSAAAMCVAGCVSYSPSQLAAMDIVDLCELQYVQGPNLSAQTKAAMQSELQRRSQNCGTYSAAVAQRREEFLYRETYGKHDDP